MPNIAECFDAEVRDLASDGRGVVAHSSGQIFFVDGVWPAESGRFRVTGFKGRIGYAEIVELDVVSKSRITAPCSHHGFSSSHCGACPWQFVEYSAQLEAKQIRVSSSVAKLCSPEVIRPIIASEKTLAYRNRAQLKTDGKKLGYMAGHSRELAKIDDCIILSDKNRNTLKDLLVQLPKQEWLLSKQMQKKNHWTQINLDESTSAADVSINQRLPFQQANTLQNENMRRWLGEKLASLDKNQDVLELFCGSGNFTEIIVAQGFSRITAVEVSGLALDTLKNKQLANVKIFACDLFESTAYEKIYQQVAPPEILILDPPREGLKNSQGLLPKKTKIKDILYISCNLATFTRDLAFFAEQKFKLIELQPLDQFPHTPHIEIMAHLKR